MKPYSQDMRDLLDDVIPPGSPGTAPDRPAVLEMVRQEHTRRRRLRVMMVSAAVLVVAPLLWWKGSGRNIPTVVEVSAPTPAPAPIVVRQVDDQQLLALLKDTPAALMEWPNGERTLLVLDQGPP